MRGNLKSNITKAAAAVEHVEVSNPAGEQNLKIQGNEFAHGLQKVTYKLNKALPQVKSHLQSILDVSKNITNASHDIVQDIHNFRTAELKLKIKQALKDAEEHVHALIEVDLNQEGGHHVKDAIHTLLKAVQKLEINANFLGKSKEDIRNEIDAILKRIEAALNNITKDEEKNVNEVTELWRKLNEIIDTIIAELDEFVQHNPEDNPEHLKTLKEVSQKLGDVSSEARLAIKNHGGLADVKQKLSSTVSKVAEELRKLVQVKEGDESAKARTLDKVSKSVLIEGLAGATGLANHLEAIGQHDQ